jgi:glycosyltransferase involved in cell wall biosynthesis
MKIAWFTPFSKKSAIGKVSQLVTAELARHIQVDIWHPETPDLRETHLITIPCTPASSFGLLRTYDLVVYSMGNYLAFHREVFSAMRQVPGVVILHDFVMHHFFAGYYVAELQDVGAYVAAMRRLYGPEGRRIAQDAAVGRRSWPWTSDEVMKYPLFEPAIEGAFGVVVHSEFLREHVERAYSGPVKRISLAYEAGLPDSGGGRKDLGVPDDNVLAVTIGHVNPNKRVHDVIETLGRDRELTRRLTYAVIGPCDGEYRDRLLGAIRRLGLEKTVLLLGYTPDDRLTSYLAHADFCINLRHPAMEGGSASLAEEMLHGKPVLVMNAGCYSELPDDCVAKINPEGDEQELARVLKKLITDPVWRQEVGGRGQQFAQATFRAERYASDFLAFLEEVKSAKPVLQYLDRIACHLRQMGVSREMVLVDTVARESGDLFGER